MVATTVTPLLVRVVLRRRIGRSFFASWCVSCAMISALEGTSWSLYFEAVLILRRFTSSRVAERLEMRVAMISFSAASFVKLEITEIRFGLRINKLH